MKQYLLIHYGEIGLKRKNIEYFLKKLGERLKRQLEQNFRETFDIKHSLGRFLIELPADFDEPAYRNVIGRVFGIRNFKFVYEGSTDIKKLGKQIFEKLPDDKFESFRVRVKRSMPLAYKSVELERELGAILLEKGIGLPVKMKNPDLDLDLEFFNNHAYFSFRKHCGLGGLSSNSQGKLVALLSSGFDSPVAAYLMMKRGARVIFVHFHGYPYTDEDEMDQVKQLVRILGEYQADTKLYLVPYGQIQKAIATNLDIPGRVRTILYRRIMLRIGEVISKKERAKGLVTGDSFGQVASQTPDNIFAIHDASTVPVFQPLIGFDKEEIINISRKIGTYDISKLPCKDTCTMFMPKHPELKAKVYEIREYEKLLPVDDWVIKVLKEALVVNL